MPPEKPNPDADPDTVPDHAPEVTEEDPRKKPSLFSRLKEAAESGKSAATITVVALSVGSAVYGHFKPEQERAARVSYETLKPVVESTANEVRELRIRLDYYEKMLQFCAVPPRIPIDLDDVPRRGVRASAPAQTALRDLFTSGITSSAPEGEGEDPEAEADSGAPPPAPVDLPDAPWEK